MRTKVHSLPELENKKEIERARKYKEECETCRNEYYGTGIGVDVNVKESGVKTEIENGYIWTFTFTSNTAVGMQFYFSKYKLPAKASLFIYNEDYSEVLGAFTHANNYIDEKFATEIIEGKKITLEYFEARDAEFSGVLEIYKVIHVFQDAGEYTSSAPAENGRWGDAPICTIDALCPEGLPFRNERKAVCRISYYDPEPNLTGFCSGFLVNNNQATTREPYVITASHCVKVCDYDHFDNCDPSNPIPPQDQYYPKLRHHEWIFEFAYEKSSCGFGSEPDNAFNNSVQGASLLTRHKQADFALFDLQTTPIENMLDVSYLGWDKRDDIDFSSTVNISHPSGDAKKVALSNHTTESTHIYFGKEETDNRLYENPGAFPRTHWVINWAPNKGVTQRGSSGSPLIDQGSKLAVGYLSGGLSGWNRELDQVDCSITGPDYFARFAYAWDKFDPPYNNSLGYYLDRYNTTQILSSYIPYPEDTDDGGTDPGGGTGGDRESVLVGYGPARDGVLLNPTYMLGDFKDLDGRQELCEGNNIWKVAHGTPYVNPTYHVQLVGAHHGTKLFSTAIKRTFNFVQGKEYVLSMEVYNSNENDNYADYLEVILDNDIPTRECAEDIYSIALYGQRVLRLHRDRYKGSYDENKWWTFAIKFIAEQNYNNIYIRLRPRNTTNEDIYYYGAILIDRIGIDEKGDFNNPQVIDTKTILAFSEFNDDYQQWEWEALHRANKSITVGNGTSALPTIETDMDVTLVSKSIVIKPGFHAKHGSTFRAEANDCIGITPYDQPVGPLDHNVVSTLRSNDKDGFSDDSLTPSSDPAKEIITDYSAVNNYHKIPSPAEAPGNIKRIILTPNPASSTVTITCSSLGRGYYITLLDVTGKIVQTWAAQNGFIETDISQVPKGLYIVRCEKGQRVYHERLVVK